MSYPTTEALFTGSALVEKNVFQTLFDVTAFSIASFCLSFALGSDYSCSKC